MRIGIFTDTYPPYLNGVSTSIKMLEKGLKELGHSVYIITVNPKNYKYEIKDNIIYLPGIPTNIYDYRISSIYSLKASLYIRKLNLDVIHSHTEFGVGTFARVIAKELLIPIVHTYHTMYEDYKYYITKGYFDKETDAALKYFINYYCDKTVDELIVPTNKIKKSFKTKYGLTRNIHVIPTGIDISNFYQENFTLKEISNLKKKLKINERFITLFVGRLGEEKSVDKLINYEVEIAKEIPNHLLLIIGDGPDKEKLEALTKKLNLTNNVLFLGKIEHSKIYKYYQLCDIFTTASKSETQGLTVIEAMAAGKLVLAIKDDAFKDFVNSKNGYLFKNKEEYINKTIYYFKNKEELIKISKQAKEDSLQYSYLEYAKKVLKVYTLVSSEKTTNNNFLEKAKIVMKRGINNE